MPTTITLRSIKGSALTHNEVDDNFSNLKTTADAALPTASLGANVATALAVNVGSAGAFVVLNGAGGTPSALTLTNATGLPPSGVTGTAAILGANVFTGEQSFNSTSIAGMRLNNLTTAQRDALTPLTGMMIWNTTTARSEVYNGSAWQGSIQAQIPGGSFLG